MLEEKPIFLIGMERSGTSLIRAVLHSHTRIGIPARGELQFFRDWMPRTEDLSQPDQLAAFAEAFFTKSKFDTFRLPRETVLERFASMPKTKDEFFRAVMTAYAAAQGKARWGEKSTTHIFHMQQLLEFFPASQCILIMRDPRDTYLSVKNVEWHKGQDIKPGVWGKQWRDTYAAAIRIALRRSNQFYFYCHERLVETPEAELARVLDFLGEAYEPTCLTMEGIDWSQNSSFGDRSDGVSAGSVGRWREMLTQEDLLAIESACHDLMDLFGYERATAPAPPPATPPPASGGLLARLLGK